MFKKLNESTFSGECPYCAKSAFKFLEGSTWMFLCHECQRYMPWVKTGIKDEITSTTITNYNSIINLLVPISSLPNKNRFREYCERRKLPLDRVYYTDKFDKISEFAGTPVKDSERIVLPFYNSNNDLIGIQGRSIDQDQLRYITLMFDKDQPKLFGLEQCNTETSFVVVEGPIDSLFVKNAIAMAGSDADLNKYKNNAIVCLDNEPRNKQIVQKMAKFLDNGYKIVIWPESVKEKDINDMVLRSNIDIDSVIQNSTYSGLAGKIKLNTWKKV